MNKRIKKKVAKRQAEQKVVKTVKPVQTINPVKQFKAITAEELVKGVSVRFKDAAETAHEVLRVAKDKTWADIATENGNKRVKDPLNTFVV